MARSQNSSRGRFSKKQVFISASGGLYFSDHSSTTALFGANSTGLKIQNKATAVISGNTTGIVLNGGIKISNKQHITANSTGFAFGSVATKPSARSATHKWAFMKSAAGTGYIVINTTAATWKYVQVTSALNTTSGYA